MIINSLLDSVGAFKFSYFIALRDAELDRAEHALIFS